ncbi:MAG: AAA family ATPase [Candidatus Nanopelagicaceae bacterium]|nr:AAA family ATPase [Candidatus Nanopelagicaceae bacterium]
MINIKAVTISGFGSFDEGVRVELSGLGPTLIVGRNDDDGGSNGAGKSTLANAVLWCLSGKLPAVERPGDDVIGWDQKECLVRLETGDGYVIERKRKKKASELTIFKDGVDLSASTTTNAQATVAKIFGFDYELFTAGTFFGQFGRAFMELPDARRRKAIERLLNLHKLNARAEVAKEKLKEYEQNQTLATSTIPSLEGDVASLEQSLQDVLMESQNHEERKAASIAAMFSDLKTLRMRAESMISPNVDDLKKQWEKVTLIETHIGEVRKRANGILIDELIDVKADITSGQKAMDDWRKSAGTICPKCRQKIDVEHSSRHAQEVEKELVVLQERREKMETEVARLQDAAKETQQRLDKAKPKVSVREAEALRREVVAAQEAVKRQERAIAEKRNEDNPYNTTITATEKKIVEKKAKLEEAKKKASKIDKMLLHLQYLHGMYGDRNKLKSLILADLVPYLNTRLSYYLEAMGSERKLEFNQFLQCKSDRWDYEFFSGGERKRVDVALMFALYDLHSAIYGRQCNFLVLDEVDGRLDAQGVQAFVDVVWKDFAPNGRSDRPDSVFVISHKTEMVDAFPNKLLVVKKDGKSRIQRE